MRNHSSENDTFSSKEAVGKFKAALIDLDGLLINSEELYLEANKIYFRQNFNFDFTEELHRRGTGRRFEDWIKTVVQTDKSGHEILQERNEVFFEFASRDLKLLPGAEDFLKMVKRNFRAVLVSTSRRDYVEKVLELAQIGDYFDVVITGNDVRKAKPDPEPYLVAAAKLGVRAEQCIVFEDAPTGILSAKNALMKVIAVPSKFVIGDPVFEKADLILSSLVEADLGTIKSLS